MTSAGRLAGGDRGGAVALTIGAALLAPIGIVGPMMVAPLFVVVVLVAAIGSGRRLAALPFPRATIAVITIAWLWAGASALWAIDPAYVPRPWLSIGLSAVGGILLIAVASSLSPASRERIGDALAAGIVVALLILTVEAVPRYLMLHPTPQQWIVSTLALRFEASALNRASTVISISVWIAAVAIARRHGWRLAWLLPAWAAMVAPAFESLAAVAAGAAGAACAVLASRSRALTRHLMLAAIALGVVLMPLLPHWGPFSRYFADRARDGSIWHRAEIWSFVAERIAERPVLGWGLNAARNMPGGKDQLQPGVERLPLHPHNGVLQLWLELGGVGAAFGAAIAVLAVLHATAPARERSTRIAMTAAIAAALTVIATAYGLWQGWWMAALWLMAALACAMPRAEAA